MSAENTEPLPFVSLKLCFLGFVHRHNELFFSYLWSFVHEFTSSSTNPIASWWKERPHIVQLYWIGLKLNFCWCWGVCVQSNIYVARVLHFSAFIIHSIHDDLMNLLIADKIEHELCFELLMAFLW